MTIFLAMCLKLLTSLGDARVRSRKAVVKPEYWMVGHCTGELSGQEKGEPHTVANPLLGFPAWV